MTRRSDRPTKPLALLLAAALSALCPSAEAQEQPTPSSDSGAGAGADASRAQQLFDRALTLADQARWAEACPLFRQSLAADPGVGTLLNVASCSAREGKTLDAVREYRRVLKLNESTLDAERKRVVDGEANQALKELSTRLGKMTVVMKRPIPGARFRLDGVACETGSPIEVVTGEHVVSAEAEGFRPHEQKVTLGSGQALVVAVDLVPLPATAHEPPQRRQQPSGGLVMAGWISGLVGAGGLAAGAVLLGFATDRASAIRDECGPRVLPPSCPRGSASSANQLSAEGERFAIGGVTSLSVGGAAVGAAIALLSVDFAQRDERPAVVAFSLAPGAVGLSIEGRLP